MKTKAIIEVAGAPKEHIENVIKEIVEKIKNEKDIERFKIFEAQEKDKMFFTYRNRDKF